MTIKERSKYIKGLIEANERRKNLYQTAQECKTNDDKCKFIDENYNEMVSDLDEDTTMNMEAEFKMELDDVFRNYFRRFNCLKSRDKREKETLDHFKNSDEFNNEEKNEIEAILLEEIKNRYP